MSVVDDSKYRQTNVYSLRDRQLLRTPPDAWGEMPTETANEDKQPPHLDWWWTRLMRRLRR